MKSLITRGNHLVEKMAILKEGTSHWPGDDGKMTAHSNFKLKFSERSLDIVKCFFVPIWCDLRSSLKEAII